MRLELEFEDPALRDRLHGLLAQYDAPWLADKVTILVSVTSQVEPPDIAPIGSYIITHHAKADRTGARLVSMGHQGTTMDFDFANMAAHLTVPHLADFQGVVEETEQQFILLLARAWAECGWTPLHGGTLIAPDNFRCAFLCAPSGVGKTTLTAALLRRGWRTLGDDKSLLRKEGTQIIARSLARRFHLHPSSNRWFPEAGDITTWPTYSRWTDKRVVHIENLWPNRFLDHAIPGAVVQLERDTDKPGITVQPLDQVAVLNVLMKQVSIPSDASFARPLIACLAAAASQMRGAHIKIGENAFSDPDTAERLECELKKLLA